MGCFHRISMEGHWNFRDSQKTQEKQVKYQVKKKSHFQQERTKEDGSQTINKILILRKDSCTNAVILFVREKLNEAERSYTTLITGFRKKEGEELEGKDEDEKVRLGDGEDREVQFFLFF